MLAGERRHLDRVRLFHPLDTVWCLLLQSLFKKFKHRAGNCTPTQETIALRVFHPKQHAPTARTNVLLEGLVRDIVSQSSLDDLSMRFFGNSNGEAISGRITGRIQDPHEQPRDIVIVAFENLRPVGYTEISCFPEHTETAEIAMFVRTDKQRRGIGKVMLQEAVREMRENNVKTLTFFVHPDNVKMKSALQHWSRAQEWQDVPFQKALREGEVVYAVNVDVK